MCKKRCNAKNKININWKWRLVVGRIFRKAGPENAISLKLKPQNTTGP